MAVIIDRKRLHAALDTFLDDVEKRALSVEDGEEHVFKIEGGRVAYDNNDELVGFMVTTSRRESV